MCISKLVMTESKKGFSVEVLFCSSFLICGYVLPFVPNNRKLFHTYQHHSYHKGDVYN